MPSALEQIASYFNANLSAVLQAQTRRVGDYWQPRTVEALAAAADECQALVLKGLAVFWQRPWTQRDPGALRLWLAAQCARQVDEGCRAAQALLLDMVRQEAALAGQALNLGGWLGPEPAPRHPDPGYELRRLAAVRELERAVGRGYARFWQRLGAKLSRAGDPQCAPAELNQRVRRLCGQWRAGLAAAAATAMRAAATRLRLAAAA